MLMGSNEYIDLVNEIKQQIQSAQYRAALKVHTELVSEEEIVQEALAQITWYHHVTLMDKVKDRDQYIQRRIGGTDNE